MANQKVDPYIIYNQSTSKSDFIKNMGLNPNDRHGGAMYDNFRKMASGSGGSSYSFNDSGTTPSGGNRTTSIGEALGDFGKKTFGIFDSMVKTIGDVTNDLYNSQMGKEDTDSAAQEIAKLLSKGGANPVSLLKEGSSFLYQQGITQLEQESKLLSEVNTKTGISGQLSQALRDDMAEASIEAKRFGFSLADIGELYTGLVDSSGKFAFINKNTMESAAPVAATLSKTMGEMATIMGDYETIGVGVDQTIKNLDQAATKSISLGMSARKVTDTMNQSMGKLNEYGFKNGVKGLEDMSRKALEFRMNMDSVFSIADKVFDATSAIDFTANLQVLGGAIGDFNDPLKLMYMATNNVEGLQDALVGAAGGLATYNREQGRFEVTSINLRKSKEMAQQMGISMGELNKIAIAAAERSSAAASLMASGLNMPEKDREFLTNISRMENGEMKIVVPKSLQDQLGAQPIELEKLTQAQKDVLIKNQEAFEKMDSTKIAMSQLTETQQIGRQVDVIAAYARVRGAAYIKGAGSSLLKDAQEKFMATLKSVDTKKVNVSEDRESGVQMGRKIKNVIENPVESGIQMGKDLINKGGEMMEDAKNSQWLKELTDKFTGAIDNLVTSKYDKNRPITIQNNLDTGNSREYTYVA